MPPALNIGESIEVRLFKWPRRPTGVAHARFLGRDKHGVWLGVSRGDSFWTPDGMRGGVFEQVRLREQLPDEVTKQAESACARVRQFVEEGIEPFGTAGRDWLARFSKT